MISRRTYWHLEGARKIPSEYEIVSSKLLYYPDRGFEVKTPLDDWYRRYQRESKLRAPNWEEFRDPRETTYASYVALEQKRETFVDGLLGSSEQEGHDRNLSSVCTGLLARFVAPLCYPVHGLQMVAAYVGSMAPGGRLVMCAAFQTADEVRRIQRIAYRTRQLAQVSPSFGTDRKPTWQSDPAWQPWRRLIERLLCVFDWGEALIALNLAIKPALDRLFSVELGRLLESRGERILPRVFASLHEDSEWHLAWAHAAVRTALAGGTTDGRDLLAWFERLRPEVLAAAGDSARAMEASGEKPGFAAEALDAVNDSLRDQALVLGEGQAP